MMLRIHGPNRAEIATRISTAPDRPMNLPDGLRFVFVCFTNRCGSAHLGDVLMSTGRFGQPFESLNAASVMPYCQQHGVASLRQYFECIVRRDAHDGIYIVKVVPEQIVLLCEAGILDQIIDHASFLLIHRSDRLGQAISLTIAQQNNRWAWDSPGGMPDTALDYAPEQIVQNLRDITLLHASFEQFFGLNGIVPVTVEYARLVAAPQQVLDEVAQSLQLSPLQMQPDRLRYRRQAGAVNRAWRARFLQDPTLPSETLPGDVTNRTRKDLAEEEALKADIVAHVSDIGDVAGGCGDWIGRPGSGRWIEGFSITPRWGIAASDLQYSGISGLSQPLRWMAGGTFCGTRGQSLPLCAISVRLCNTAHERFRCAISARFVDGAGVGPLAAGTLCYVASLAPVETFQFLVSR